MKDLSQTTNMAKTKRNMPLRVNTTIDEKKRRSFLKVRMLKKIASREAVHVVGVLHKIVDLLLFLGFFFLAKHMYI